MARCAGCAAALAAVAAASAILMLPNSGDRGKSDFRLGEAKARYVLVLTDRRSFVCFGVVFLEGLAI